MPNPRRFYLEPEREQERRALVKALEPFFGAAAGADDEFLSTREVALIFRVSPATVRRWADNGKLGARRSFGGHRIFPVSAVRDALQQLGLVGHGLPVAADAQGGG